MSHTFNYLFRDLIRALKFQITEVLEQEIQIKLPDRHSEGEERRSGHETRRSYSYSEMAS